MHLEPTELELRMSAFHTAVCEILAEVAADVVVLRTILDGRGLVPNAEYRAALDLFGKDRLSSYQKELSERIYSRAERILEKLRFGPGPIQ